MALELNDPRIREAYKKIRAAELDWAVLGYGGTRNVVTFESSGTGIDNMVKALTGPANYAYVRNPNTNKFILCVYLTPEAGSVMKAKVAVHKSSISELFHFVHVMIQSANAQDFVEEKLKKAVEDGPLDRPKDDLDPSVVVTFDNGTPAPVRAPREPRSESRTLREETKPEPVKEESKPEPVKEEPKPEPVKEETKPEPIPEPKPEPVKEEPKPEPTPEPKPEPVKEEPKPEPIPEPEPEPVKEEPKPEPIPEPEPEPVKEEPKPEPIPDPEPEPVKEEPKPEPIPDPEPELVKEEPKPEPVPIPVKEEPKPEPVKQETYKPAPFVPTSSSSRKTDEDEYLEQLTEEELNQLMQDMDTKGGKERVKPRPMPTQVYADDPEKEARRKKSVEELEALISKLEQNSKEVPVILNLTSHEFLGEEGLERLGLALANNTIVTELILANVNMTSNGCVFLVEALKPNTNIVHINLESNAIGGEGFEAIAEFLTTNTTLKELRLTNQRNTLAGKSEKIFVKAIETNTSLQKLGVTSKDQTTRNQLDKYIFRNKDLARQRRVAEQKTKK